MKTIEILSNGQKVQFTTKSVTVNGKEHLYSHITELRHSEAKRVYGFKCDDEVIMLPYEEKDAKTLKVIFSQVQQMHRHPAPAKAGQAQAPAKAEPAPAEAAQAPAEPAVEETPVAEAPVVEEAPVAEEVPAAEVPAEVPAETPAEVPAEETAEETPAEPILSAKEKKRLEKEKRKADKEAAKREKLAKKAAAATGGTVAYEEAAEQMDPVQKSARFKKAIIIFCIILAVFVLLGIAYYFLIGPASDPQIGPNSTDQTQYNDIDDMINDLEN